MHICQVGVKLFFHGNYRLYNFFYEYRFENSEQIYKILKKSAYSDESLANSYLAVEF